MRTLLRHWRHCKFATDVNGSGVSQSKCVSEFCRFSRANARRYASFLATNLLQIPSASKWTGARGLSKTSPEYLTWMSWMKPRRDCVGHYCLILSSYYGAQGTGL